jgi:hypothetical protein
MDFGNTVTLYEILYHILIERGVFMWINIGFDSSKDFSKSSSFIEYDNIKIEIKKGEEDSIHNLFIETNKNHKEKDFEAGLRFLSELAWLYNCKIIYLTSAFSSDTKLPVDAPNQGFNRILNVINLKYYKQVAFNDEQKLALGIYKEGISSNSIFYKFLSFFKIINIKNGTGSDQKEWINNNIKKLKNSKTKVKKLKNNEISNIGKHLYESGRCAIAHANTQPVVDANKFQDIQRISSDTFIIKELAEIFIKEELNVKDKVY